jgi:hypothetical protein
MILIITTNHYYIVLLQLNVIFYAFCAFLTSFSSREYFHKTNANDSIFVKYLREPKFNIYVQLLSFPICTFRVNIFVREHGVHAGPKDYFVVVIVVVVVIRGFVKSNGPKKCSIVMHGTKKCSIVMYKTKRKFFLNFFFLNSKILTKNRFSRFLND